MAAAAPSPSISQADEIIAKKWVVDVYDTADGRGAAAIANYLTEDAVINFGNSPPLKGRPSIEKLCAWEYSACKSIDHSINDIQVHHDLTMVSVLVTYHFTNDHKEVVKCWVVWHKTPTGAKATGSDIYGDFGEVFKELIACAGLSSF